jgi:hypothetical protein
MFFTPLPFSPHWPARRALPAIPFVAFTSSRIACSQLDQISYHTESMTPRPIKNILGFLNAITKEYVLLLTGGLITATLGVFERLRGRSIPWSWYCAVLLIFVVTACFRVWMKDQGRVKHLEEELEREKGRQSKPSIRARIQQVRVVHSLGSRLVGQLLDEVGKKLGREFEDQPVDVYVQLYLTNESLNAPTTIRDYQLVVTNGEKQVRGERFTHIEGETLEFDVEEVDGHGFTQTRRERKTLSPDLAAEINRTQIEFGKPTVGWLRFGCKGIKPGDVRLDSISLVVVDAFDTPHRATAEPGALLECENQNF